MVALDLPQSNCVVEWTGSKSHHQVKGGERVRWWRIFGEGDFSNYFHLSFSLPYCSINVYCRDYPNEVPVNCCHPSQASLSLTLPLLLWFQKSSSLTSQSPITIYLLHCLPLFLRQLSPLARCDSQMSTKIFFLRSRIYFLLPLISSSYSLPQRQLPTTFSLRNCLQNVKHMLLILLK